MRYASKIVVCIVLVGIMFLSGCVSCIPQYVAPPVAPASACYPSGNDPFIPMDHNPSLFNPWDLISSVVSPFLYGPPR